jgi:hypothetical protein
MLTAILSSLKLFQSCCNLPNSSKSQETEKYRRECREEVGSKFGLRGNRVISQNKCRLEPYSTFSLM